ncbi:MAG: carboxy-S-adenosyl-L-methionine synthase CmoA [Calditrichaceae bacterium]|jgi:tRNA (cmo5U34)-methyltransferase
MKKDRIYRNRQDALSDFAFDENVAGVFSDMIHRSLPGYDLVISMIKVISGYYREKNRNYYDLGCSLGASTISMGYGLDSEKCKIIAVDNSQAMISRCNKNIADANLKTPVELICADLQDVNIENAKIVVMNFTLQFIEPEKREIILKKISKGLVNGGVLILSEKITFGTDADKILNETLYVEFKKANGYSDLEISQKRTALEKVLVPETIRQHLQRLDKCGFSDSKVWYRCLNFSSIIAFK